MWHLSNWMVHGVTQGWCHTATSVSFLVFHRCYSIHMRAMILIHTPRLQVGICALTLRFLACCSLAKQCSTFMARGGGGTNKQKHEWGYECHFQVSATLWWNQEVEWGQWLCVVFNSPRMPPRVPMDHSNAHFRIPYSLKTSIFIFTKIFMLVKVKIKVCNMYFM